MATDTKNTSAGTGILPKQYTLTLPPDVAHILEVRAAIDNLKPEEGMQQLLCRIVEIWGAA